MMSTAFSTNHVLYAKLDVGKSPNLSSGFNGQVWLRQEPTSEKTIVTVMISGLSPSTSYGLHVHEKCDASNCNNFGGHWDTTPGSTNHGKWNAAKKHIGDLPSCDTDVAGNCFYEYNMSYKLLFGASGFANVTTSQGIVLHSMPDDFGVTNTGTTTTTGNAGSRLACGCLVKYFAQIFASLTFIAIGLIF